MQTLWADLRYAARLLRQNPGFSLVAMVTLALGIGATTAIFSVVDTVLIRPLPYPEPDRLVSISTLFPKIEFLVSPEYVEWRQSNHVLDQMAAYPHHPSTGYLTIGEEPLKIGFTRVSDNFFDTLGVHPKLGRGFLPEETRPGGRDVIVLSDGLWKRAFGADPGILGRSIIFEAKPYTVVGVLAADFEFPEPLPLDALTPLPIPISTDRREMRTWNAIGRLKRGVTFDQARAEFQKLFESTRLRHAEMYKRDTQLRFVPWQEYRTKDVRLTLLILLAAVATVLLIACGNVASLSMAKTAARQTELSIRAALGARRLRLVRQLFTESVLLALLGGTAGVVFAMESVSLLRRFGPRSVPGIETVSVDLRVLTFAFVLSLITGLIFGIAPALGMSRAGLRIGASRLAAGAGFRKLRRVLVAGELALSLVLLICGSLLIESLWNLQNRNMGFQPEQLLTAGISLTGVSLPARREIMTRLTALPGTTAIAFSDGLPPGSGSRLSTFSRADAQAPEPWHRGDNMLARRVTPDYFRVLGIRLLKGRLFNQADRAEINGVAIVNETLARRYFSGEDPLGKQIDGVGGFHWKTIVGIVADTKNRGLDQPVEAEMFTPFDMDPQDSVMSMAMRTTADPLELAPAVRDVLRSVDRSVPVTFRTMDQNLSELVAGPRFNATLFGTFAAIALVLALVGTYGVLSYSVVQRTQEIGIRMALGARTPDIVKLIGFEAMALTMSGVLVGVLAARFATRYLASQLYGVKSTDVVTFVAVSLLLIATAAVAAYLPARRALGIEPMTALRAE